jgi:hypothetical protein
MEPSSLRCSIPADWNSNFSRCLYDWQGLEAGALALAAAIISVLFLRRQIKQQQIHRADEISRAHVAARVRLPLALAATSDLAATIANEVSDEFESYDPNGHRTIAAVLGREPARDRFKPVSMPNEVLASFADFVASHDNTSDVRHVAELVASVQILLSRYNGFDLNQPAAQYSLASLLLDAGKVKLLNEKIYNYARFVDDSSFGIVGVMDEKAAWDGIHGQAQSLVFTRQSPDIFFPDFQRRIDGHKEHNTSPWNEKFG